MPLCQCGCGQPVGIAKRSYRTKGVEKGQPLRYLTGHHTRRSSAPACGYAVDDETGCWVWLLRVNENGYGRKKVGRRDTYAHIVIYEQHRGPLPAGVELDHLCRNRACVNPDHLEPVSHTENVRRSLAARLTIAQVIAIRECTLSNREIGLALGVSHRTIQGVKSRTNWRDVPQPALPPTADRRDLSSLIVWSQRVAPDGQSREPRQFHDVSAQRVA